MSFDPSSEEQEQMAAVLSLREQWRLLSWIEAHPAALEHALTTDHSHSTRPATPARRAPVAYALGLVVGTLWVLLRRWQARRANRGRWPSLQV